MRDFTLWEPDTTFECALCGRVRDDQRDPPGPWFRHRPSHRRRIPILGGGIVRLGYLEYIRP